MLALLVIISFLVVAGYDVILQLIANKSIKIPFIYSSDWLVSLIPYFREHTPLAAALIAGFVGATSQLIIYSVVGFPLFDAEITRNSLLIWLSVSLFVSGFFGILMKFTGLFPKLDETYYRRLGAKRAFITDVWSGAVAQSTIFGIFYVLLKSDLLKK